MTKHYFDMGDDSTKEAQRELRKKQYRPRLKEYDRWGWLECTGVEVVEKPVFLGRGIKQDWTKKEITYHLRCYGGEVGRADGCKRDLVLSHDEFPGKRVMLDCGCMSGGDEGERPTQNITTTVWIEAGLMSDVKVMAREAGKKQAQVVRDLIMSGLQVKEPFHGRMLPKRGALRCLVNVTMPDTMMKRVLGFAEENGLDRTKAVQVLIKMGMTFEVPREEEQ